ncbi:TPA: hypothetical protein N0F65_005939 [Lagenidium giganteum]|uniref:Uncharacterized protein n=1 Tax=Lagenidium giganteum TaxID=4803 RepID=A0AAV2ZBE0_9STRA|nr:TPA: hypothetical protein N0F65_005939 [Lagenidium giganteum]
MTERSRRKGAGCVGVACEHTLGRQPLHLYGYLWTKPEVMNEECGRFGLVLPDTVLFKHHKPLKWFFTSKQDRGKILSKCKKHVSVNHILTAFLTPKTYRGSTLGPDPILATYVYAERSSVSGEPLLVIEHLDRDALTHLLGSRERPSLSVLQRFIPTKSGYNHLIQSIYTPELVSLRKCVNPNVSTDTKFSVGERAATFECDEKDIRPRDVTNRELTQALERINHEISGHMEKIVGKEIMRHVCYFKVGADDRIYMMWSTMVSFEPTLKSFAKHHTLSLPIHEKNRQKSNTDVIIRENQLLGLHAQLKCCVCCNTMLARHLVNYLVHEPQISHIQSISS